MISSNGAVAVGRVTDERTRPVSDYTVLVFSTMRDRWTATRWVKTARGSQDGTFRVQDLPAGDYWIAAVDRIENLPTRGVPPPELLELLSFRATRIILGEGQSQDVALRLIRP